MGREMESENENWISFHFYFVTLAYSWLTVLCFRCRAEWFSYTYSCISSFSKIFSPIYNTMHYPWWISELTHHALKWGSPLLRTKGKCQKHAHLSHVVDISLSQCALSPEPSMRGWKEYSYDPKGCANSQYSAIKTQTTRHTADTGGRLHHPWGLEEQGLLRKRSQGAHTPGEEWRPSRMLTAEEALV